MYTGGLTFGRLIFGGSFGVKDYLRMPKESIFGVQSV